MPVVRQLCEMAPVSMPYVWFPPHAETKPVYLLHVYSKILKGSLFLKGELQNRFNLISEERVKIFEQNFHKKHFLTSRYVQMIELMMSLPH